LSGNTDVKRAQRIVLFCNGFFSFKKKEKKPYFVRLGVLGGQTLFESTFSPRTSRIGVIDTHVSAVASSCSKEPRGIPFWSRVFKERLHHRYTIACRVKGFVTQD
jgi:hypothetical protein